MRTTTAMNDYDNKLRWTTRTEDHDEQRALRIKTTPMTLTRPPLRPQPRMVTRPLPTNTFKMTWYGMVTWYWYEWDMVWVFHTMVLVWCSYTTPGMGTIEVPLNQRIHIPHRYPKMGDWSGPGLKKISVKFIYLIRNFGIYSFQGVD